MRRTVRQNGFTMVEVMVAIGILVLLAGITVLGFRQVSISGKRTSTESTLTQCRSLLTEYETKNKQVGIPTAAVVAPGWVEDIDVTGTNPRYNAAAIAATNGVMGLLQAIPENRAMLAKLPGEKLLRRGGAVANPILLDAWNNPVLFVPAGGLSGVTLAGTGGRTVTSRGVIADGGEVPVGARPFWASAGPDGNFAKGDDNLYSFEKQ